MDDPQPSKSSVETIIDRDSLFNFPSPFPIKVMGRNVDAFVPAVIALAQQFDSTLDASSVELRPSSTGTYVGLTITVLATSRAQLDALYQSLSSHELVKVVL